MEMELGKLFIGGISWDTNEERLRNYFENFGQVLEAVIMKDRNTGRARGFGFVVFADPFVADSVVSEKHVIDGRTVEAKKAVPRDDHSILPRTPIHTPNHASPAAPVRTKKIFVGGLASTVTETDFKLYFDQFGLITDVVVMYDHNTQRPRGFGFITFDSEEAVDNVLLKTFHELNGKMVEVKRAVPKELSPGPTRNQMPTFNYSPSRVATLINGYPQSPIGNYGVRMDGRFSPVNVGRSSGYSYPPLSPPGYGMGLNFDTGLGPSSYGGGGGLGNITSALGYGRGMNPPAFSEQSNRYNNGIIGYGGGNVGSTSTLSSLGRNLWGNQGLNYATNSPDSSSNPFMFSGNGGNSGVGVIGSLGAIWSSPISGQRGTSVGTIGYENEDSNLGPGGGGYARNRRNNVAASNGSYDGPLGDVYQNGSMYEDPAWQPSSSELEGSGPFGFGLPNAAPSNASARTSSAGYVDGYGITNRQSIRGIAA